MFKYRDYTSLSSCQICSFERIFFPSKSTFCSEKEKCRDEEKPEYCNVGAIAVHCGKLRHAYNFSNFRYMSFLIQPHWRSHKSVYDYEVHFLPRIPRIEILRSLTHYTVDIWTPSAEKPILMTSWILWLDNLPECLV